jgi:hypothetical protein
VTAPWQPGDPIHLRPIGPNVGQQFVRSMFQVLNEDRHVAISVILHALRDEDDPGAWCDVCWVVWRGGGPCWVCGGPATDADPRVEWEYVPSFAEVIG